MDHAQSQQSQPCLHLAEAAFATSPQSELYYCSLALGLSSAVDRSILAKVTSALTPEQHFSTNPRNHPGSSLVDYSLLQATDSFGVILVFSWSDALYLPRCVSTFTSFDPLFASLATEDPRTELLFP